MSFREGCFRMRKSRSVWYGMMFISICSIISDGYTDSGQLGTGIVWLA